jgi:hypothetical protein
MPAAPSERLEYHSSGEGGEDTWIFVGPSWLA